MKLADYLHKEIYVFLEGDKKPAVVILRGVDLGGIWIESHTLTDAFLEGMNLTASEKTPIAFVPYAQLKTIFAITDFPSLSEKSFGVARP